MIFHIGFIHASYNVSNPRGKPLMEEQMNETKGMMKMNKKYLALACAGVVGALGLGHVVSQASVANQMDRELKMGNETATYSSAFDVLYDIADDQTLSSDVYDAYTYEEVMAMTPQERRGLDEKELGQLLGQEDKFYKVFESTDTIEEVNPATGVYRWTDKLTGEVEEDCYYDMVEIVEGATASSDYPTLEMK